MPIRKDLVSSLPIGKKLLRQVPIPPPSTDQIGIPTPVPSTRDEIRAQAIRRDPRAPTPEPVPAGNTTFADVVAPLEGGPKKIEVPSLGDPTRIEVPTIGGPSRVETPGIKRGIAGEQRFEKGVSELRGPGGISPEIQSVLDIISAQTEEKEIKAESRARALAGRRGVEGGTIEQAGVASAVGEQTRIGRDISTNVLLESARSQIEGRRLAGGAQVSRAGQQAQIGAGKELAEFDAQVKSGTLFSEQTQQNRLAEFEGTLKSNAAFSEQEQQNRILEFQADIEGQVLFAQLDQESRIAYANLTSDELASIRNLSEAAKDRELQRFLGERGIQVQLENIAASKSIAKQQGKSAVAGGVGTLVGTIAGSAFGPIGAAVGGFLGGSIGKIFPF